MTPEPGFLRTSEGADPATIRPVVVKIGGSSLDAPGALDELAAEVRALSGGVLLVHGGGAQVSQWCLRLSLPTRIEGGLRVTDDATMDVAAAVLGGLVNSRLVARLLAAGVDALGLRALDAGLIVVEPHPDAALGRVGRATGVQPALLETLLQQGRVPVLASIGAFHGTLLNVNADEIAGIVAPALHARALLLLSDTPGVRLDGEYVPRLDAGSLAAALSHPDVQGGMRPKLAAAAAALAGGVPRVAIGRWTGAGSLQALLDGTGAGTTCLAATDPEVSRV